MTVAGGGLTTGGMDDRFDFQHVTATLMDGEGMSYIGPSVPNTAIPASVQSYTAFGNNGSTFNGADLGCLEHRSTSTGVQPRRRPTLAHHRAERDYPPPAITCRSSRTISSHLEWARRSPQFPRK